MYRKLPLLSLSLLVAVLLSSCGKGLTGDDRADIRDWVGAAEKYQAEYKSEKDPDKRKEKAAKVAEAYSHMNNYAMAESWMKRAIEGDAPDPTFYYQYANILKSREKYPEALAQLEEYQKKVPGNTRIAEEIEITKKAIEWKENEIETRFKVEKEKFLSSGGNDYAPVITSNGLVFTSDRPENKDVETKVSNGATGKEDLPWNGRLRPDIFIAANQRGRNKDKLDYPVLIDAEGVVNRPESSDGTATFDKKGRTMYFSTCNRKYEDSEKQDENCIIMYSELRGRSWTEPVRMPFCTDTTSAVQYAQPMLSDDEQRLYFSSNMPGGQGGHDIWMCTWVKKSRTWSDPINLGPTINTDKDEMFPYPYQDALYFASNGHVGIGGLDLFVSYGRGQEWTKPENLLPPMNSGGDDFSICFETDKKKVRKFGESGYFASNRKSPQGVDNIYSFKVVPLKFSVSGIVYDDSTKLPIANAKVTLTNFTDSGDVFVTTDDKGYYYMKLYGDSDYDLRPYKERYEYLKANETVSTKGFKVSTEFERDLYLTPFRPVFELDILYDLDKADITPLAAKKLDEFAETLKEHYYTVMELSSHTDCRGDDKYNEDLAQRRAESAVNYLVSKGIEKDRLKAKGYGEYNPKKIKVDGKEVTLTCDYVEKQKPESKRDELHQANRRTEIRILSWDYQPSTKIDEGTEYIDIDLLREQELKKLEEEEGGTD